MYAKVMDPVDGRDVGSIPFIFGMSTTLVGKNVVVGILMIKGVKFKPRFCHFFKEIIW